MEITPVSLVLPRFGFNEPKFKALIPNEESYKLLLFQPKGDIEIGDDYIRHRDRHLADLQFRKFLQKAQEAKADLVVSPEYSMPWDVLISEVKADNIPEIGKLWALGCESLAYSQLESIRIQLAGKAELIYEPLEPEEDRFVCPLAYVFKASALSCPSQLSTIILVQFKTYPMGGIDFEINRMQKGTQVYQFGDGLSNLRLISLICSDAFAFKDSHAEIIYSRTLILHIQLNAKPRHNHFRSYRSKIFNFFGDETEIICLNWAQNVHSSQSGVEKDWNNASCSAWYLRPNKFDTCDATLSDNHRLGLYYTHSDDLRLHALFLNFEPAMFLLQATKVAHIAVPGPMSMRLGPRIIHTFVWKTSSVNDNDWIDTLSIDDGFSKISDASGNAKTAIDLLANENPFAAERVLALCTGKIGQSKEWYRVDKLDSIGIDLSENISRLTFCQDSDEPMSEFRITRLKRCARLWDILKDSDSLPPALSDFKIGFSFEWSDKSPHQNMISAKGIPATVMYMGEDALDTRIKNIATRIAENLRDTYADPEKYRQAVQRLSLWYRSGQQIERYDCDRFFSISETGAESEVDIARAK